jgi:excisionase family DNA binding protein
VLLFRVLSAWIIWQVLHEPLRVRIRQLECDPAVSGDVVRHLRVTAAAIGEAARQYRDLVAEVADSADVSAASSSADLGNLPNGWGVAEVAASLNCSERWVRALIAQGRLVAAKRSRSWLVDLDSVKDFKLRGISSAA